MNDLPPIADIVPHAGPALLIDRVFEYTDAGIRVRAEITSTHPWLEPGHGVPNWVGIEMMAQACAAHAGLTGRRAGQPPQRGMLLGTRHYQGCVTYFPVGACLDIEAHIRTGSESAMKACDCRIQHGERTLAEACLVVAVQPTT